MNLTVVIPAYNEEKNLKYVLNRLKEELRESYELIVVDDYSSDETYNAAKEILKDFDNSKLTRNKFKKGFANALKTGFKLAGNEIIIPVMADLCDEISLIPGMYDKILEGYDIVGASRDMRNGRRENSPLIKTFFSKCFNKFVCFIVKIPYTDTSNAFKAYRKCMLDKLSLRRPGFELSAEILLKAYFAGYKITELPTTWRGRVFGVSHFSFFRDGAGYLSLLCGILKDEKFGLFKAFFKKCLSGVCHK